MFWFTVSMVFLIVWLNERADLKKKIGESYAQGVIEGRRAIQQQVQVLLNAKKGSIDAKELRALFGDDQQVPEQSQTDKLNVATEAIDELYQPEYEQEASYLPENNDSSFSQPVMTPQELEAEKIRRTTSNLNAMLYVGSFLIVAAAALFVNLTMPAFVKLLSVVAVTAAFYIVGLVLYAKSVRLRSAAIAFVGTGLAILPFVGFALRSFGGLSNEAAWFVTSAVGLIAYGVAAVYLRSQLVSYITMVFVLSLALSTVSTLSLGVLWYFIVLIGVSIVMNSIHYLWPRLLPQIFAVPLDQTSKLTTPIALGASLFMWQSMELFMYEVLFGIATLHYAVVWLESRTYTYELVTRGLGHVTALLFAFDVAQKMDSKSGVIFFGIVWLVISTVQLLYSVMRADRHNAASVKRENIIIGIMFVLMIIIIPIWMATDYPARWVAGHLFLIGALSVGVSARFRQVAWSYIALVASVLVPIVVGLAVIEPALSAWALALVFASFGAVSLVVLDQLKDKNRSNTLLVFWIATTLTYAGFVALSGIASNVSSTLGWTMAASAAIVVLLSYSIKTAAFEFVGAILGVVSVAAFVGWLLLDSDWHLVVSIVVSAALLIGAVFAHHSRGERERRNVVAIVGAVVVAGLIGAVGSASIDVVRAATLLLLASGIGMLALRIIIAAKNSTMGGLSLLGYIVYPILSLFVAFQAGGGWVALVTIIFAGMLWTSSYIEKQPAVLLIGNTLFVAGISFLWSWLSFSGEWLVFGVAWLSATVFYLMYWFSRDRNDSMRQELSFASVLVVLGIATVWGMFGSTTATVIASAGSLLMASAVIGLHGYIEKKDDYIEASLYTATFALQRIVTILVPPANIVFYGHWWAIVLISTALWRKDSLTRPVIALASLSLPTGMYALMGAGGYSLFFLVEHLVVAVVGALTRKQWAMWWGIAAVIIAILYFLRNYTVAALLFLGFLIILFVVWRLMKSGSKE